MGQQWIDWGCTCGCVMALDSPAARLCKAACPGSLHFPRLQPDSAATRAFTDPEVGRRLTAIVGENAYLSEYPVRPASGCAAVSRSGGWPTCRSPPVSAASMWSQVESNCADRERCAAGQRTQPKTVSWSRHDCLPSLRLLHFTSARVSPISAELLHGLAQGRDSVREAAVRCARERRLSCLQSVVARSSSCSFLMSGVRACSAVLNLTRPRILSASFGAVSPRRACVHSHEHERLAHRVG